MRLLTDEEITQVVDEGSHQAIKISLRILTEVAAVQDAKTAAAIHAELDEILTQAVEDIVALRAKGQALADVGQVLYENGYDFKEKHERNWEATLADWNQT